MAPGTLHLSLDGFDGPLDLLLDLARAQQIDLAGISIVALVDQYLALVEGAVRVRVELAADWLVMAAWLTWLKSRLLLPPDADAAAEASQSADVLASRLAELAAMREGAAWLAARPALGFDVFPRGMPETLVQADRSQLRADLPGLLRAYVDAFARATARIAYQPRQLSFWTVQDAVARLTATLGQMPGWSLLEAFVPRALSGQERRAAIASTLIASLELARGGTVRVRQDAAFSPILLAWPEC